MGSISQKEASVNARPPSHRYPSPPTPSWSAVRAKRSPSPTVQKRMMTRVIASSSACCCAEKSGAPFAKRCVVMLRLERYAASTNALALEEAAVSVECTIATCV
eukprot:1862951-Prymnesium_polylepis.1